MVIAPQEEASSHEYCKAHNTLYSCQSIAMTRAADQAPSDFVLKLTLDNGGSIFSDTNPPHEEFRRVRLSQLGGIVTTVPGSDRYVVKLRKENYSALMRRAKDYFAPNSSGNTTSTTSKIWLTYEDDDGESIVFDCAEELQDAIESILNQPDSPHHMPIRVRVVGSRDTTPATNSTSTAQSVGETTVGSQSSDTNTTNSASQSTNSIQVRDWKFVVKVACFVVIFSDLLLLLIYRMANLHTDFVQQEYKTASIPSNTSSSFSSTPASTRSALLEERGVCSLQTVSSGTIPTDTASTTPSSPDSHQIPPEPNPQACLNSSNLYLKTPSPSSLNVDPPQTESTPRSTQSSSITSGGSQPDTEADGATRTDSSLDLTETQTLSIPSPTPTSPESTTESAPSSKKEGDSELLNNWLSDVLQDEGLSSSPFMRAYQWVLEDPHWKRYPKERLRQRFGLIWFYFSTNGYNWKRSDHWLSYDVHECQWFPGGFTMSVCGEYHLLYDDDDRQQQQEGSKRKQKWQYERLWLPNNGLEGTLPSKLFQLIPTLGHVRLDRNIWLSGSLPSELGLLKQLSSLWLQHNMFSGSLPSTLGQLSRLEKLSLAENDLQGSIPPSLFAKTTNLRALWLDHNRLTGPIPSSLGNAPLAKLNLAHNHFATGGLPAAMLGSLTRLEHLVAPISSGSRMLSSSSSEDSLIIPSQVGLLTNLRHLDMYVSPSVWWSLSTHKWERSEVASLYNLETLRVGTERNDDELIDLLTL